MADSDFAFDVGDALLVFDPGGIWTEQAGTVASREVIDGLPFYDLASESGRLIGQFCETELALDHA